MINNKRNKICIDCRPLNKKGDGISRYLTEIIAYLVKMQLFDIYLISNKTIILDDSIPKDSLTIIEDLTWKKIPGTLWLQIKVPLIISKMSPDVFWGVSHILPMSKRKNTKYLLTIHDMVFKLYPETMTLHNKIFCSIFMKRSIYTSDEILSVSHTTKRDILKFYPSINPDKITVQYLGGAEKFPPLIKCQSDENKIFILGSLEPRKNIAFFIDVFSEIIKIKPSYRLHITGANRWKESSITKKIKQLNIEDKIIFHGYLSDDEVNKNLHESDLFVFPSKYEGFGLPLVEAQGKTKIVASKIPVFEELSVYYDNIMLFSLNESYKEIAKEILEYSENCKVSTLKNDSLQMFTWRTSGEIVTNAILSLLKRVK